jgi:hypothetical protein
VDRAANHAEVAFTNNRDERCKLGYLRLLSLRRGRQFGRTMAVLSTAYTKDATDISGSLVGSVDVALVLGHLLRRADVAC